VQIQGYATLIASLLLVAWTQKKPNKRTFEMLCFYFAGWATDDELQHHSENNPCINQVRLFSFGKPIGCRLCNIRY
jgi:hypothetical protein